MVWVSDVIFQQVDEVLSLVHYDLGIEQDVKYGELSKVGETLQLRTLTKSWHLSLSEIRT